MSRRGLVMAAGGLVLFWLIVVIARHVILGGIPVVTLRSAAPLSGQVSQALGLNPNGSLPVVGKDYTLVGVQYFDNTNWALVNIRPVSSNLQGGFAVMKKNEGVYQVVLGPGSAVASTQLSALPPDLASFLVSHAAVYNPIPGQ